MSTPKCTVTIKRGKCEISINKIDSNYNIETQSKSFRSLGLIGVFVNKTIDSYYKEKTYIDAKKSFPVATIYNVYNPLYFLLLCKLHADTLTRSKTREKVELILEDDYSFILRTISSVSGSTERKIHTKAKQMGFTL